MNKLKFSWIIWGMVMIAIVVLLYVFGATLAKKNKPYKVKENELVEIAKMYVENSTWYPEQGNSIRISVEELKENGFVKNVIVDEDECKGYVEITNKGIIEYKAYLKCNKYTTHGYN